MKPVFLALLLVCCASNMAGAQSPKVADGSIVYVWNGNAVVQRYTHSKITHVGMVINIEGEPWFYEAELPKVRKMKLSEYVEKIASENVDQANGDKLGLFVMQPKVPYADSEIKLIHSHLDTQIGRRYSLRGYVHEKRMTSGIHCSALVADALNRSGRYKFQNTDSINPCALVLSVKKSYSNFQVAIRDRPRKSLNNRWANRAMMATFSCEESIREMMHWFLPIQ